jgi:hypothetical protein
MPRPGLIHAEKPMHNGIRPTSPTRSTRRARGVRYAGAELAWPTVTATVAPPVSDQAHATRDRHRWPTCQRTRPAGHLGRWAGAQKGKMASWVRVLLGRNREA